MSNLADRCRPIRLILSDVDGVLTDGSIWLDRDGGEIKRFHVRDGLAIKLWQKSGGEFGLVSSRSSPAVERRARELGISLVKQGVPHKLPQIEKLVAERNLTPAEVAYIGDDLPDLTSIRYAGLGSAPADGVREVRTAAAYVTETPGGLGALRELIEMILKAQGKWEALIDAA